MDDKSSPSGQKGTSLNSWGAVESHIRTQDTVMIDGLDDDINTLLVFAGLFSAVLTAFIVESYQWLQDDASQVTLLALVQLLGQLGGTTDLTLPTPNGGPSIVQIFINVLWFSSLVASLASALFGMMAKQWLREYISWTSSSASARQLSHLRQIRRTAWHDWHAPSIIGIIPAVLEISLVLFLCGLAMLLWTLNHGIATFLTFIIALLTIAVVIVIILPTFFLTCPYRSLLAWGFLAFWNKLSRVPLFLNPLIVKLGGDPFLEPANISAFGDWLSRDLDASLRASDDMSSGTWLLNILRASWPSYSYQKYTADVKETETLLQCLIWVVSNSRDQAVLREVYNCTAMIHTPFAVESRQQRLRAGLHAACNICGIDPMHLSVYRKTLHSQTTSSLAYSAAMEPQELVDDRIQAVIKIIARMPSEALEVVSYFLFHDVVSFLDDMVASTKLIADKQVPQPDHSHAGQLSVLSDAFSFFKCTVKSRRAWNLLPSESDGFPSLGCEELCRVLCRFSGQVAMNHKFSEIFPGFKATIQEVLCELATIRITANTHTLVASPFTPHKQSVAYAELAIRSYQQIRRIDETSECRLGTNSRRLLNDERHSFVVLSSRAITIAVATLAIPISFRMLFSCMTLYSKFALQEKLDHADCFSPFPWIDDLLKLDQDPRLPESDVAWCYGLIPRRLFFNLQQLVEEKLITVSNAASNLAYLLDKHVQVVSKSYDTLDLLPDASPASLDTALDQDVEGGAGRGRRPFVSRQTTLPPLGDIFRKLRRLESLAAEDGQPDRLPLVARAAGGLWQSAPPIGQPRSGHRPSKPDFDAPRLAAASVSSLRLTQADAVSSTVPDTHVDDRRFPSESDCSEESVSLRRRSRFSFEEEPGQDHTMRESFDPISPPMACESPLSYISPASQLPSPARASPAQLPDDCPSANAHDIDDSQPTDRAVDVDDLTDLASSSHEDIGQTAPVVGRPRSNSALLMAPLLVFTHFRRKSSRAKDLVEPPAVQNTSRLAVLESSPPPLTPAQLPAELVEERPRLPEWSLQASTATDPALEDMTNCQLPTREIPAEEQRTLVTSPLPTPPQDSERWEFTSRGRRGPSAGRVERRNSASHSPW